MEGIAAARVVRQEYCSSVKKCNPIQDSSGVSGNNDGIHSNEIRRKAFGRFLSADDSCSRVTPSVAAGVASGSREARKGVRAADDSFIQV